MTGQGAQRNGASASLAFSGVTAVRGGRTLFDGLSFALESGDAALVTGPNGVGKSSLVRIAAGLLAPAAGSVRRNGDCALLAESHALDPELPLVRSLGFWAAFDRRHDEVALALTALGLESLADVPVRMLSTGQKRRAGLARVAASGAALWLLDEPANGLDEAATATLERLIATHRAGGGIVLVATHLPIELPDALPIVLGNKA